MKTLKNISLCMFMKAFQTHVNHKDNLDYGPRELADTFQHFYSIPQMGSLQQASSEPTNTSLFPDFLLAGEVLKSGCY